MAITVVIQCHVVRNVCIPKTQINLQIRIQKPNDTKPQSTVISINNMSPVFMVCVMSCLRRAHDTVMCQMCYKFIFSPCPALLLNDHRETDNPKALAAFIALADHPQGSYIYSRIQLLKLYNRPWKNKLINSEDLLTSVQQLPDS